MFAYQERGRQPTRAQQMAHAAILRRTAQYVADQPQSFPVQRGDNLTLPSPAAAGLYNQLFLDLCGDADLISLSMAGSYSPLLDELGLEMNDVIRLQERMFTYFRPAAAGGGGYTTGLLVDACAPGEGTEVGTCDFVVQGFGTIRRSTAVRDVTQIGLRWCEAQPLYRIDGSRIMDDAEYDRLVLASVIIQDFHRRLIIGNKSTTNDSDGLRRLINFGYINPTTSDPCPEMDSVVIDWNENVMCPDTAPTGVTFNGVALGAGVATNLYDMIAAFLRRTYARISHMPALNGAPRFVGIAPIEHIACLIQCWVCHTVCGGDIERLNDYEARITKNELMQQFNNGQVTLTFDGYPVTWYAWDYELLNPTTGLAEMMIMTTRVGAQRLMPIQLNDANRVVENMYEENPMASDGGRFLSWETHDHTCFQTHEQIQWRLVARAPWAQMRIIDVKCDPIFGHITFDPTSPFYLGLPQEEEPGP